MGLGALHTLGLAEGKDLIDERDAAKGAATAARGERVTFDEAAEAYLQKYEDGWKVRSADGSGGTRSVSISHRC
jgi:hypothetical protein